MPESYSCFLTFCSTVLVDPFDPYSLFKFFYYSSELRKLYYSGYREIHWLYGDFLGNGMTNHVSVCAKLMPLLKSSKK